MDGAIDRALAAARPVLIAAVLEAAKGVKERADGGIGGAPDFEMPESLPGARALALAASILEIVATINAVDAPAAFADDDQSWGDFEREIESLLESGAFAAEELARAEDWLALMGDANRALWFERVAEYEYAIRDTLSDGLVELWRAEVARAVEAEVGYAKFLESIDAAVSRGALPGEMDAYLQNVYRTETASLYAAQREDELDAMDDAGILWGVEFENPNDGRSRDTHAALDGAKMRRGGKADMLNRELGGGPPWSYQCRCVAVPLMAIGQEHQESPNILSLIRAVERFDS